MITTKTRFASYAGSAPTKRRQFDSHELTAAETKARKMSIPKIKAAIRDCEQFIANQRDPDIAFKTEQMLAVYREELRRRTAEHGKQWEDNTDSESIFRIASQRPKHYK